MAKQNKEVIAAHRAAGGRLVFNGMPIVLLTTTGRRSGLPVVTPVAARWDGTRVVFCASAGGRPRHPGWYLNIAADPRVRIEFDEVDFETEVQTLPLGPERERLLDLVREVVPGMRRYDELSRPHRVMPVVVAEQPGPQAP
jgi:deazaflavin-dependent oxidoreductase (nitroreductase family)